MTNISRAKKIYTGAARGARDKYEVCTVEKAALSIPYFHCGLSGYVAYYF